MPLIAADVDGAGVGDADMVAPLLDRNGKAFGVLALRGLPHRARRNDGDSGSQRGEQLARARYLTDPTERHLRQR